VAEPDASASHFAPRAAWAETGDAAPPVHPHGDRQRGDLLAATLATLAWANIDPSGYAATWNTVLMIRSGTRGLADSWQGCVKPPVPAIAALERPSVIRASTSRSLAASVPSQSVRRLAPHEWAALPGRRA